MTSKFKLIILSVASILVIGAFPLLVNFYKTSSDMIPPSPVPSIILIMLSMIAGFFVIGTLITFGYIKFLKKRIAHPYLFGLLAAYVVGTITTIIASSALFADGDTLAAGIGSFMFAAGAAVAAGIAGIAIGLVTDLTGAASLKNSRPPFTKQVKLTALILGTLVVLLPIFSKFVAQRPDFLKSTPTAARGVLDSPRSEYVALTTAKTASDDLFIYSKERTRIFVLYRVDTGTDVPVYGQLLDAIEPYRRSGIRIIPLAVGKYSGEAFRFLSYATDLPDWNLHQWLSLQEYQKLATLLKPYGLEIGESKNLPYVALLNEKDAVIGQWQGSANIYKLHSAMKSLGFSAEPRSTPSVGDAFVSKTAPRYLK
jgi:hypothetical protein